MSSLKLAMVAPPFGITGGPEQVVYNLVEELVKLKVDVTLFAPADWTSSAKHVPTLPQSMWNMPNLGELTNAEKHQLITLSQQKVLKYQKNFDLIHLHSQRHVCPVAAKTKKPCVLSIHSLIEKADFKKLQQAKIYTITLSQSQRGDLDSFATIHNGIPISSVKFSEKPGKNFIFIGRLNEQKGVDRAVKLAQKSGIELLIFGRVGYDPERKKFFREKIEPYLNQLISYRGEVAHTQIYRYLREAKALLLPISKPETNSMVGLEALASGTPIIGTKQGPLPELFSGNNQISFLSNEETELINAIKHTDQLFDRRECRKFAEENFDSREMAEKYLAGYEKILTNPIYGRNQSI